MSPRPALALVLVLGLAGACGGLAAPDPQGPLTGDRLVEALRAGGLVLYLRHTETSTDGVDDVSTLGDCSQQRELTDAGRQDARELGAALDALGVPVSEVVASPFCRTTETAELAFGRIRTDEALLPLDGPARTDAALERGRALIATEPPDGENVVLVGHISNVWPITGASPEEGGTVVLEPDGDDVRLVAEVPPGGWQRLAERTG